MAASEENYKLPILIYRVPDLNAAVATVERDDTPPRAVYCLPVDDHLTIEAGTDFPLQITRLILLDAYTALTVNQLHKLGGREFADSMLNPEGTVLYITNLVLGEDNRKFIASLQGHSHLTPPRLRAAALTMTGAITHHQRQRGASSLGVYATPPPF